MAATSITDAQGIVAILAAGAALVALLACAALTVKLRRYKRTQQVVLGEQGDRDLVAHAADMQSAFAALSEYVEEIVARIDERLLDAETALRGTLAHRSLVRYDAYNELSGRQSMSIALLDEERSGIVLSCIHHRDQARVYAKQVHGGQGEMELSPEEAEAVRVALASPGDGGSKLSS